MDGTGPAPTPEDERDDASDWFSPAEPRARSDDGKPNPWVDPLYPIPALCGWNTRRGDGPVGGPCRLPAGHDGQHDPEAPAEPRAGDPSPHVDPEYRAALDELEPHDLTDYQRGYVDGFDAPANVTARAALRDPATLVAEDREPPDYTAFQKRLEADIISALGIDPPILTDVLARLGFTLQGSAATPEPSSPPLREALTEYRDDWRMKAKMARRAAERGGPDKDSDEGYAVGLELAVFCINELLERFALKAETPEPTDEHPEAKCQRCGGPNPVWFAPNEQWNAVRGDEGGIVCPSCFAAQAEAQGIMPTAWTFAAETPEPGALDVAICEALLYVIEEHGETFIGDGTWEVIGTAVGIEPPYDRPAIIRERLATVRSTTPPEPEDGGT